MAWGAILTGCMEQMSQAKRLVNVHLMEKDYRGPFLEEVGRIQWGVKPGCGAADLRLNETTQGSSF